MLVQDVGTNATIRSNRIHDGQAQGVEVFDGASASIEGNDICANTHEGVAVAGQGTSVALRGNLIHGGAHVGIFVTDAARCEITDNRIFANALGDLSAEPGTEVTLSSRA